MILTLELNGFGYAENKLNVFGCSFVIWLPNKSKTLFCSPGEPKPSEAAQDSGSSLFKSGCISSNVDPLPSASLGQGKESSYSTLSTTIPETSYKNIDSPPALNPKSKGPKKDDGCPKLFKKATVSWDKTKYCPACKTEFSGKVYLLSMFSSVTYQPVISILSAPLL